MGTAKNGDSVDKKILEEIGKSLAPYKKRLSEGYQAILGSLIGSKDFKEAHERLQRKILWETIVPGTVRPLFSFCNS